ncbi:MAG: hypothetical protein QG567_268 [Campylobacterota bacterium]|nr:hypothetical protein [Campylobacterota bacterium]
MKKVFLFAFIVLILFFGCTTKTVDIKNYEVRDIKKVNVGENLVKVGSNLVEDMKFNPIIDIEARLKKEEFYIPIKPPYDGIFDERDKSYFVIIDKHEIFSIKVDNNGKIINGNKYFPKDERVFEEQPFYLGLLNSKLYEISYAGRLNDIVYLMYKEYYINVEDIKREINQIKPGFSERIAYDLKESDILVYKNFKFKVYDATSKNIEFEIISDSY